MLDQMIHRWIINCLDAQHRGEHFTGAEHDRLISYVDLGILGMDGFKYCWPEEAKENRRKMLGSQEYRWSEATIRKRLSA